MEVSQNSMIENHNKVTLVLIFDIIVLFVIASITRLVSINHSPYDDEMFHVLAAQSWSSGNSLSIGDGVYNRAYLFTIIIGYLFQLFGENLIIARLPALFMGVLWVIILFIWLRFSVGRMSGYIASLLFCFAPHAIELSQFCRFYTLHGVSFLLSCITIYIIFNKKLSSLKNSILGGIALFLLIFAYHLQITTLIGIAGLVIWIVIEFIRRNLKSLKKILFFTLTSIITIVIIMLVLNSTNHYKVDQSLFHTPYLIENNIQYYHKLFLSQYPSLWPFLPIAIIFAIIIKPNIALPCSCIFLTSFIIHSIAGTQEERHIYYAVPFFFVIWGIIFQELIPYIRKYSSHLFYGLAKTLKIQLSQLSTFWIKRIMMVIIFVFFVLCNGAFPRTIHTIFGKSYFFGLNQSNWETSKDRLLQLANESSIVISTNFTKTLYYLDRLDIVFSKNIVEDSLHGKEFEKDPRFGKVVISSLNSLKQILSSYSSGLFIIQSAEWRSPFRMDNETADFLESQVTKIELPEEARLIAFYWKDKQ